MIIVHFEVYVMEGRGWMLHARFPRLERDDAVREARELESTLGVRTKVLRETYNTDTNAFDEVEVYLSGHNIQPKKAAAGGAAGGGGGGWSNSGRGGKAGGKGAARKFGKGKADSPSIGAGSAILRLTVILLIASAMGLGALRLVPTVIVFLYDYGFRITPDEYGQLLTVVFGLVFLMSAVPIGLRFMPRNANIRFRQGGGAAAAAPLRPQPSEAVKKSLNKLARKAAEEQMIPETWGDEPIPEPEPPKEDEREEAPPPLLPAEEPAPTPEEAALDSLPSTPAQEAASQVADRFVEKAAEVIRQTAPAGDKYTSFGVNLFMAGAVQSIARGRKLDSGGQRKLLKSVLEKLGTPGGMATALYDKLPEYQSEQRYARMIDAGRSAMESWTEGDEGTPMIKFQTSLKDWNKPATDKKPSIMTIMFTDMVGSTDMTQARGDVAAQEIVRRHNAIVRTALTQFAGHEVKHTGDGIMASFTSAANAVEATIQIQRHVAAHNEKQPNLPLHLRIGLNAGEPIQEEDDLFGSTVQLAARVCAATESEQILCTQVVKDLAGGKGSFSDAGMRALKGFRDKFQLWEVAWR
jgi:class 3 adenylate cyclase